MDNSCCRIIDLARRVCNNTAAFSHREKPIPQLDSLDVAMRLNVLRELQQHLGAVSEYDVTEDTLNLGDAECTGVVGSLRLLRTDSGLLVTLHATARMDETCSRCLTPATCEVQIDFEEEYVPLIDPITQARPQVSDPDTFRIGTDYTLDLTEGLRQYVLMSEPAKPLCKADCAGLCPTCGADLNAGPCACAPAADARWQVLAGLIDEREGS